MENQLRGACIIQELLWQSGWQLRAGICLHTQWWSRPSSRFHPTPNIFCSQLFSSVKPLNL